MKCFIGLGPAMFISNLVIFIILIILEIEFFEMGNKIIFI